MNPGSNGYFPETDLSFQEYLLGLNPDSQLKDVSKAELRGYISTFREKYSSIDARDMLELLADDVFIEGLLAMVILRSREADEEVQRRLIEIKDAEIRTRGDTKT